MQKIRSKRQYSLSAYLILIVLVSVVPVLLFSTYLVNKLISAEQETSKRYLLEAAREVILSVDEEIQTTVRTLEAISMSEHLRRGDLKEFSSIITRVLKTQPTWDTINLHDNELYWLLSARVPYGKKLGNAFEPESIQKVINTGKYTIGKITKMASGRKDRPKYGFAVRVPVKRDSGEIAYVLSAVITTDVIQAIASRKSQAPNEWARGIIDSEGHLVARSREPEKYVGRKVSDRLLKIFALKKDGLNKNTALDGIEVYTAFKKADFSGWYSAIAVPADYLESSILRTKQVIISLAFLIFLFTTLATIYFSHRIKRAIKTSSEAAALLAEGKIPRMDSAGIAEIEELHGSLISASELLQSRDRAKDQFIANMSHELRTPLGIVVGMADILSKDFVKPHDQKRSWEIIKRNSKHLQRLIDDILDLSKAKAEKLTVENIRFSIRDLVSSVAEDFSSRANEKNVRLKTVFSEKSPDIVNSDPVRIRQIIVNLLGNAVKFTSHGQITVQLHEMIEDQIRISVTDSGIGLTHAHQVQLFSEFTQADGSHARKYGGTGLGLSLSRKLARLLGGDVILNQSVFGEGSTFECTFRNLTSVDGKIPGEIMIDQCLIQLPTTAKILIADDSSDNIELIKFYIQSAGVTDIEVATNGLEAVEKSKNPNIELILMDIQMPDMDGYEATRKIRERGQKIPIIALTAHALAEHRQRAIDAGCTDVLIKPLQHHVLVNTLGNYLKNLNSAASM